MSSVAASKPTVNSFEARAFRFMRTSGVLMIPLVFGHFAIVHLINSVSSIDTCWVITTRWNFVWWRLYDAGMLWFAAAHGMNGMRYIINDYVHQPVVRRVIMVALIALLVAVLFFGSSALLLTRAADPACPLL